MGLLRRIGEYQFISLFHGVFSEYQHQILNVNQLNDLIGKDDVTVCKHIISNPNFEFKMHFQFWSTTLWFVIFAGGQRAIYRCNMQDY